MNLAAASLFTSTAISQTSEPENVMVVLDASGSMWGQIDGVTKIEIARDTLRSALSDLSPEDPIGLIAYGHRRQGDCDDIELVSPVQAGTAEAIADAVDEITPSGKTPLSAAVRLAAEELKSTENNATVILLTDGLETCNADPCALGRELEESGVDFTVHVIGLGLTRDEDRQMSCLAEETGGLYLSADNADELGDALEETIGHTEEDVTEEEPIDFSEATLDAPETVVIGERFSVAWTGPDNDMDYLDIMPAGTDQTSGEASYQWTEKGSPLEIVAPGEPGDYQLRYVMQARTSRHVLTSQSLTVVPGEFSLSVPEQVTIGMYFPVSWSAATVTEGSYIDLVPPGYTNTSGEISYSYVYEGRDLSILAPIIAGVYDLRFVLEAPDGRMVKFVTPVTILEAEASVDFPRTLSPGTPFNLTWSGPINDSSYLDIVPAGYTETHGEMDYAYLSYGDVLTMTAPDEPGEYQVRFVLEAAQGIRRVLYSAPLTVR